MIILRCIERTPKSLPCYRNTRQFNTNFGRFRRAIYCVPRYNFYSNLQVRWFSTNNTLSLRLNLTSDKELNRNGAKYICLTNFHSLSYQRQSSNISGDESSKSGDSLFEKFWHWRLTESPEYATKCGVHRNDDKLEELTEESFTKQKLQADKLLTENKQLLTMSSNHGNIHLQLLSHVLSSFIDGYEFRRFGMYNAVTTADGVFTDWKHLMTWMNFDSEDDYEMLLLRLRSMARQVFQKIELMRLAIENGTTLHRASLGRVLGSLSAEIDRDIEKSFCYGPFLTMSSEIDNDKRWLLQNEYRNVMTEVLVPSLVSLKQFIIDEYLPATRPEAAVTSLPDGDKFYDACLKWHLSMDLTPEEIHEIGLEEVDRLLTTMDKLKSKEDFRGSLRDFMMYIHHHPSNCNKSEESMLKGYRKIIVRVQGRVHNLFHDFRNINVIVKRSRGDAYTDPSLDGSRPGIFWADVSYPQSKSKSDMVALALHEAIPGHHTQACYALDQQIPRFRQQIEDRKYYAIPFNWPIFTAYVEGWALYAESLGEEMGMYTDNYSLFGRYMSELFRASRLVVDTGIHHYRWSKRKAMNYLKQLSSESIFYIESEINRYITWPGQSCAYKIGELEIRKLRELAEDELGDSFDVRDFHDEVLSIGPVPLDVLERHIRDWIDSDVDSDDAQDLASS